MNCLDVPFCWFAHSPDDFIQRFPSAFLESLWNPVRSSSPPIRWSTVKALCFSDPCSNTEKRKKKSAGQAERPHCLLCWMQYDPHWLFTTSTKTTCPELMSLSTMLSFAGSWQWSYAKTCTPFCADTRDHAPTNLYFHPLLPTT